MEEHKTLKMLLSSIFESNDLTNWTIFEEKSGSIVVKIRFTNSDKNEHSSDTATPSPISYKKKSDNQMRRDQDRMARHQEREAVMTRSRTSVNETSVELPRFSESDSVSEPAPLEYSLVLDPSSKCFVPRSKSVSRDKTPAESCIQTRHVYRTRPTSPHPTNTQECTESR